MIDARGEPCVNGDFADLFVFTSLNETFINDSSTLHIVQFCGRNTNAVLRKVSNTSLYEKNIKGDEERLVSCDNYF